MRRRRSRALLALWLALFLIASGESALRVYEAFVESTESESEIPDWSGLFVEDADPVLRYRNMPSVRRTVGDVVYAHDERGRREPSQRLSGSDLPGVAFLGDSTTYGFGVAAEHSVPQLVAQALGGRMVPLNLGVCGYGSAQEVALYQGERARLPGCELVVLAVYPNDFWPISYFWDAEDALLYHDPLPLPRQLKATLRHSALYRALVSLATPRELREAEGKRPPAHDIDHVLAAIEQLADLVHADGRQLLVVNLPAMDRLDPYRHEGPAAQVEAACRTLQLPFADLLDGFLNERDRQQSLFTKRTGGQPSVEQRAWFLAQYWLRYGEDSHLDVAASRLVAEQLAPLVGSLLGL